MIYVFLVVMSGVLAVVGGLGLMTSMSLNVLERRREMGVLRAIGATPRTVWLIVVAEAVATAILSWALAALVAWPFSRRAGRPPGAGTVPHPPGVRLRAVGAAGVAVVCVLLAARRQPASGLARVALPGAGSDRLRVKEGEALSRGWKLVTTVAVVILVVLVGGGARWLWQRLLVMHGSH